MVTAKLHCWLSSVRNNYSVFPSGFHLVFIDHLFRRVCPHVTVSRPISKDELIWLACHFLIVFASKERCSGQVRWGRVIIRSMAALLILPWLDSYGKYMIEARSTSVKVETADQFCWDTIVLSCLEMDGNTGIYLACIESCVSVWTELYHYAFYKADDNMLAS